MSERIFRFEIEVLGDSPSFETFPIYDDYGILVGGFTRRQGSRIYGFIAGTGYPLALAVSSEQPFYFTPSHGKTRFMTHATISATKVSPTSVRVTSAYEENLDVAAQ